MAKKKTTTRAVAIAEPEYHSLLSGISSLLDEARRSAARQVNSILTATYWEVGRRIVEFEQRGEQRAGYGEGVLVRLAADLKAVHGRGFSRSNVAQMRSFYLSWEIVQTTSGQFQARVRDQNPTAPASPATLIPSSGLDLGTLSGAFPLPWSHYVRLLSVEKPEARAFYEDEAIRAGWSVRQLDRQVSTQFYERTLLSRNKAGMITRGRKPQPEDTVSPREEIRDPYVLEFLDLKDEYSETDLEDALVHHIESFLLELGNGFTFVARQKSVRIGNVSYRMDLVFFHRVLRALVILDLKVGKFTHEDAGQMNLYLNYAREHMMMPGEADPVGVILCSDKDDAVVHYATGGIRAQVFASRYLTHLPDEETLRREVLETKRALELRPGIHTSES